MPAALLLVERKLEPPGGISGFYWTRFSPGMTFSGLAMATPELLQYICC